MSDLLSPQNITNLLLLVFLQAVLGFDNLLYIAIESRKAPEASQKNVRKAAILVAIGLRILLLFVMLHLLESFQTTLFTLNVPGFVEGTFNFSVIVFLLGGGFIMYTAIKEVTHMLATSNLAEDVSRPGAKKTAAQVTMSLVIMNLVFSFDSILSAIAITKVFTVLAIAIVFSGLLMLLLADGVTVFLEKNRQFEVLGLFVLIIVGVVLLGEGGHAAELQLFGYHVEPLSKTTFYFSISVLVLVDLVQTKYQNKLLKLRRRAQATPASASSQTPTPPA